MRSSQQKCFTVEGNIGAGKSTFLKMVNDYLHVQLVPEPLNAWQNVGGSSENILEKFYVDPARWAHTFQMYVLTTFITSQAQHAARNPLAVQVLERSVYSARYCFAQNCFEMGTMNGLEWQLYQEWFAWLTQMYAQPPTGFIYMRTDPSVCYERLLKRNRAEEAIVPFDYIEKVHAKHEDWLVHKKGVEQSVRDTPVLILDCNKDFEHDKDEQERHIAAIMNFIEENNFKHTIYEKNRLLTL